MDGASIKALSDEYSTDRSCIYRWIDRYNEGGMGALRTRSIAHSTNAKLSPEQREKLSRIILTKDPTAYGFYKTLWLRDIIASVIKAEFNVTMHPATVSKMLRKMGLTPQRPVRKAWQQSEKKVREYLDIRYSALRKLAEEKEAIIYFIDVVDIFWNINNRSGATWSKKECLSRKIICIGCAHINNKGLLFDATASTGIAGFTTLSQIK